MFILELVDCPGWYIACQDDTDTITSVERHARRFHDERSITEYMDMLKAGRTKYKGSNNLRIVDASPLW